MSHWSTRLARQLTGLAVTAVIGAAIAAAMVRTGPGYDSDERLLEPRLNSASRAAIRVKALNFGYSEAFHRPVVSLLRDRWSQTAALMSVGVAGGWVLAFSLALVAVVSRRRAVTGVVNLIGALGLCMPAAVVAVLMFVLGGPARAVIALVLFPRLYETLRNLLADSYQSPQVLHARALGLSPARILWRYVLPTRGPELLALGGVSVVMAFGACIPVETLCDLPGIGQLAWKAAIARDLPVLVALTLLIAIMTQICNAVSEWFAAGFEEARA